MRHNVVPKLILATACAAALAGFAPRPRATVPAWRWSSRAVVYATLVEGVPSARLWFPASARVAGRTLAALLRVARPAHVHVPILKTRPVFMDWFGPNLIALRLRGEKDLVTLQPVYYLVETRPSGSRHAAYRVVLVKDVLWYREGRERLPLRDPRLWRWLTGRGWRTVFFRQQRPD